MVQRSETAEARKMTDRYKDAYRLGKAIVGVGDLIKGLGGVLAVIILGVTLYASSEVKGESGLATTTIGIGFAVFVGILFYLLGVIVAAQGQILKGVLDTAINTSPFLTDGHRAEIMSLK
jgi:hypothetical protein